MSGNPAWPPRSSASSTGTAPSQVARLLAAAAAARTQLRTQIAEAEATLSQRQTEHGSAQTVIEALEAQDFVLRAAVAGARTRLAQVEATLGGLATAAAAADARADRRTTPVGHPLAPGRTPRDDATRASSALVDATRLRDQITDRLRVGELDVELNTKRLADARQAAATIAAELEQRQNALGGLRLQLAAAGSDVVTGPFTARSLSTQASGVPNPSPLALAEVPAEYLDLYRHHASSCPGLSWTVLAAIGSIESSHGRSAAPGVRDGANFAGAMGPMQFLAATWSAYGIDGNGDGTRDVFHPSDAVAGAANYLCASGAGELATLAGAIWNYNHADWYVAAVIQLAVAYGGGALGQPRAPATAAELVDNGNVTLTADARADLLAGRVDKRAVDLLTALATNHRIAISVIQTGHNQFVAGTDRVSNHFYGRGVDITEVDGVAVTASSAEALELSLAILTTESAMRPSEFGSPWPELARFPGGFSDADHAGHLHLGWLPE